MQHVGSGTYASDLEKENGRLKRELKAHEDALNIFKKGDGYFGQRRTHLIYQCVAEGEYEISVKAALKILRVSTSAYYAWKKRKPSKQSLKKKITIEMVKGIHEKSNEIYGAPKITIELHKRGISITERTGGSTWEKVDSGHGIESHILKQRLTVIFQHNLKTFLNATFHQRNQMQCGVVISPIPGQNMDLYI